MWASKMAGSLQNDVQVLDDMHWQANGARLIHDAAFDVLPYPPSRVGGETKTAFRIEFVQRVHHAHVAFFDEIQQRDAVIGIVLGDIHYEP